MKLIVSLPVLTILFFGCMQKNSQSNKISKKINSIWLDSIIKKSDSSYSKPYKRTDFVEADFYINKKDSSVCQLMRDSAEVIRQIIIAKKNVRTFFAQYYANGQLLAEFPFDQFGQFHGMVTYFYDDGRVQSTGNYNHGLKAGKWQNFNAKGLSTETNEYDKNGQIIKASNK